MRKGFLGSLATLFAAAAVAPAQYMPVNPYYGPYYGPMPYPLTYQVVPVAYPPNPAIRPVSVEGAGSGHGDKGNAAPAHDGGCAGVAQPDYAAPYVPYDAPAPACACPAGGCAAPEGCCGTDSGCCKDGHRCGGPRECWWVHADYLLWRIKHGPLPVPLVTTGSLADPVPGALGQAGTSVVIGGSNINYHDFVGGRLTVGWWFDPNEEYLGMELSGFGLGTQKVHQAVSSTGLGQPPLFVPFFNPATGLEDAAAVAIPGLAAGGVDVSSSSSLRGADIDLVANLWSGATTRWLFLTGASFLEVEEKLDIVHRSQALVPGVLLFNLQDVFPNSITVTDSFHTRNDFYGYQLGTRFEWYFSRFTLSVQEKLSAGITREKLDVVGFSTVNLLPGAAFVGPTSLPGGFFAVPGNGGHFTRDVFSGASETEFRLGCDIMRGLTAFVGYDLLYLTSVARPGQQMNRSVDLTQVPTQPEFIRTFQPTSVPPDIQHTGFWAQGLDLTLQFRY